MTHTVHVTNLSVEANVETLRAWFGNCGHVADVRLVVEPKSSDTPPSAFVTMATKQGADQAVSRLNGALLGGRALALRLSDQAAQTGQQERAEKKAEAGRPKIAIVQQYRERGNMTYELDCMGQALIVRVFFPRSDAPDDWRIEARSSDKPQALAVSVGGASRQLAFDEVPAAWDSAAQASGGPTLDWSAIKAALLTVRAI
jgi:RNA recognition motif-containing protein